MISITRRRPAQPVAPAHHFSPGSATSAPAPENTPRQQRRAGSALQRLAEIQTAQSASRPVVTGPSASGTGDATRVRRSMRDFLAEAPELHAGDTAGGASPAEPAAPQKSSKSGLAKFTGKVKKLVGKAKTAADRNFVSSQTSVFGLHTETTVGKPVTMSATRPRPEVLQSRPVPAGTRPRTCRAYPPPARPSRQRASARSTRPSRRPSTHPRRLRNRCAATLAWARTRSPASRYRLPRQ